LGAISTGSKIGVFAGWFASVTSAERGITVGSRCVKNLADRLSVEGVVMSVSADEDIARRLQRLEDLEEIRQLFEDYIHHLDRGQFEEYAALYATDGKMRLGPAKADGRDEIQRVARESFSHPDGAAQNGRMGGFHIVSGPRVQLDGDEHRRGASDRTDA
jgi:hypothetical protein